MPRHPSGPRSVRSSTPTSTTKGLPSLGFPLDLHYIADVIAPGSFDDIQQGNNISSFTSGHGTYLNDGGRVTLTGYGTRPRRATTWRAA